MRDVARKFGVPVSAIVRAYDALKNEGILGTVRGSRTVIEGRSAVSTMKFKGFVGLPASLACFFMLADYRSFYFAIRRELRRQGFVSNLLFFRDDTAGRDELLETIKEFGIQFLVWYLPRVSARELMLRLADRGVAVVGLADGDATPFRCKYEIRRYEGAVAIFRRWQTHGIGRVTIVRSGPSSKGGDEVIEGAIEDAGLALEHRDIGGHTITDVIGTLGTAPDQGVILSGNCATIVSLRAPLLLAALLARSRVALLDGPVTTLYGNVVDGPIDLLVVDWHIVARRIVNDLTSKRAFSASVSVSFQARPHRAVSLREYCRAL